MSTPAVTYLGYALIALGATAWQVECARRRSLTLGRFLARVNTSRTGRVALLLGWAWLGWHLFARGTATFLAG